MRRLHRSVICLIATIQTRRRRWACGVNKTKHITTATSSTMFTQVS